MRRERVWLSYLCHWCRPRLCHLNWGRVNNIKVDFVEFFSEIITLISIIAYNYYMLYTL